LLSEIMVRLCSDVRNHKKENLTEKNEDLGIHVRMILKWF